MNELFDWLIVRSWQAAILVLLILAVQFVLARWLPARWRHAMWFPLLALLVLPALPESRVSVFNYVREEDIAARVEAFPQVFVISAEPAPEMLPVDGALARPALPSRTIDWKRVAMTSWATGAAGLLGFVVLANWRFRRRLRHLPACDDARLRRLLDACRGELKMRSVVRIVEMPDREGPAMTGIFRPILLLPEGFARSFDDREIRFVFLHELGHWLRGDVLVNALLAVVRALHWFNPALWLAFHRIRLDCELACDEWVLARTGEGRAYGETLLKLSTDFVPSGPIAGVTGIFESRAELKRRIRRIAAFPIDARRWSTIGAIPLFLLVAMFLTRAVTRDALIDPQVGKIVDRNGVLLAEVRVGPDGALTGSYPLGAFAAHLLQGLDPAVAPKPGEVVYLTIDARVQAAAERALREVGRGAAVVLDPANGDILAMVSVPSFDPNKMDVQALESDETEPLRNRAIRMNTPGSTMLPFTMLAGGAAGLLPRDHVCTGAISVGSFTFRCWRPGGHGHLNAANAMTNSCNTFFYNLGMDTGGEWMQKISSRVGFGEKTGIPLVAEDAGQTGGPDDLAASSHPQSWTAGYAANVAIGQGLVSVTPVQVAAAMAAIGNGGTVYRPRLIAKVASAAGVTEAVVESRGDFAEAGVQESALEIVRNGLWGTVNAEKGTAKKAQVNGMEVAGRTGTAQYWKQRGGEKVAERVGWFSGYAPAAEPVWAFSVIVYDAQSGGTDAAPIAARIFEEVRKEVEFVPEVFVPARSGPLPQPAIQARDQELRMSLGGLSEDGNARSPFRSSRGEVVRTKFDLLEPAASDEPFVVTQPPSREVE